MRHLCLTVTTQQQARSQKWKSGANASGVFLSLTHPSADSGEGHMRDVQYSSHPALIHQLHLFISHQFIFLSQLKMSTSEGKVNYVSCSEGVSFTIRVILFLFFSISFSFLLAISIISISVSILISRGKHCRISPLHTDLFLSMLFLSLLLLDIIHHQAYHDASPKPPEQWAYCAHSCHHVAKHGNASSVDNKGQTLELVHNEMCVL